MYPTLYHFGHFILPTFGALAAGGLILALLLSLRTAPLARINAAQLWDAGLFAVLAAFLLSRLLLAVIYWKTFRAFPILLLTVPSLTAPGLLLTALSTGVYLRLRRIPILSALDAWSPCGALLWVFLAFGHFAEGSDPGMPTTLPWGVPVARGDAIRVQPVALFLAVAAALLSLAAYQLLQRNLPPGGTAGWTLLAAGATQFLASLLRQPGTLLGPLESLQWQAIGLMTAGCIFVLRTIRANERQ